MDSLNYHHLRYFWTVAKEGSLSRAAAKLHVSQPSISEQIHELELSFGVKLFQREGRRNVLTDAGQIAFGISQKDRHAGRRQLLGDALQGHGLAGAGGTGNQSMAIGELRQQDKFDLAALGDGQDMAHGGVFRDAKIRDCM